MLAEIARARPNQVELVEIIGRMDSEKSHKVAQALTHAVKDKRTHLILDLARVEYINSGGLRELYYALRHVQNAGVKVYITNPRDRVRQVLELIGLDSVFHIYDDSSWDLAQLPAPHRAALYHQTFYC